MNRAPAYQREILADPVAEALETPPPGGAAHRRPGRNTKSAAHSLAASFQFALDGFCYVVLTQRNFRVQLLAAAVATTAGFYWRITPGEWLAVLLASALVLVLEMMNTAIESVVDMVTHDYHPLAKSAKDIAAAAVLLASLAAVVIALVIFGPHVMATLSHSTTTDALRAPHS